MEQQQQQQQEQVPRPRATKLNPTPGRCLDYVSGVECCASSSMLFCFLCSKKQGKHKRPKLKHNKRIRKVGENLRAEHDPFIHALCG